MNMPSTWLITRLIDYNADFFVPMSKVMKITEKEGAIAFNVIIKDYELTCKALMRLFA